MENGFLTRNQGLDMTEKITGFVKSRTYDRDAIDGLLNDKQDVLNFDNTPTENSTKPVTSGGIKTALDTKQDTLIFDTTPTANSTKPVTSGGVYNAISKPDLYEVNIFYNFTLDELKIPTEYTQVGYAVYKNGEDITNTITNFKTFVDNLNNTNNILKFYSVKSSSVDTPRNHRELLRNYMSSTNFVTVFNVYNSDVVGTISFRADEIACTFRESTIDVVDRIVEDTYGCDVYIALDVTDIPHTDIDLDNIMFANVEDYVQTIKYTKYKINKTSYTYDTEVTYTDSIIKFINNVLPSLNAHYNLSITVDIIKSTGESSEESKECYAEYITHGVNSGGYYDNYLKLYHDFRASGASYIYDYPQNAMQYVGLIVVPSVEYPEATSYCKFARVVDTELTENSNNYITSGTMFDIVGNYYTKSETDNLLNDKQDALTFDTVPTDESENPVTSDGIYNDIHINIAEDSTYESVKTLSNCGAFPMLSLKAEINAVQDLHGYDKPWAGGAGYNKCPEEWIVFSTTSLRTSNFDVNPETEYYFCSPVASQIYYRDADGNDISGITNPQVIGSNRTFTTPSGCYKILLVLSNYGTTYNYDVAVNYPSSITTYSPYSNICPISGWSAVDVNVSGVNVWDEEWEVGSIADSSGQNATNSNYRRSKNYISVKANKKYYFNVPNKYGTTYRFYQYKQNKDYIGIKAVDSDGTFETDNDCAFIRFRIATTEEYTNDISINYPSTDTEYHAYNGSTITIQLGDTYYGCKLDVINGVLTVDRAMVDLGTLNYSYYSGNLFTTPISNLKPVPNAKLCNALCSIYVAKQGNEYASIDGSFVAGFNNAPTLAIHDSRFADATAFKTAMNGVQLVYELATPLTIQLTPTQVNSLMGVNNIWANSGDVGDVRYIVKNAASDIITAIKDICYTKTEIDSMIGDIPNALDTINGEVV